MIVGIGLDLVPIDRIGHTLRRHGARALHRLFTDGEIRRCEDRGHRDASLAARFAAKEAFFKALGTGWGRGGRWTEVEVVSVSGGAPGVRLYGTARVTAAGRGVRRIHLSLSHTDTLAAAYLILEGDGPSG